MENKTKIKQIYIILVLVFLIVLYFNYKQAIKKKTIIDSEAVLHQDGDEEDIAQEVQSFIISGFSEDSTDTWKVEGESANIFFDIVDMYNIKAKYDSEQVSVRLTADEGTLFKANKDVELRKNVVAITDEGTTFKTDKAKWLAETKTLITDNYVYITREDTDITGKGAKVTPSTKKMQLNKEVNMDIKSAQAIFESLTSKIQENESSANLMKTTITCDGPLEVDYKENIAYFNENVVIDSKDGKIYADKVSAYIDPEAKKVYKAIAEGNAKAVHKQNTSYSEKITYLVNEGRTIFSGSPKIIMNSFDKSKEQNKEESLEK